MLELEHSGPKLLYQQIIEWMQQQISSGNWPEHYRLPSEIDLASQLNVSRGTVRKAITELTSEGMLVSIHGKGTFVNAATIEQPLAEKLIAFSEALMEKNIAFTTHVVSQKLVTPPQRISSLLSLPAETPLLYLERVRSVNQSPLIYLINYISIEHCAGIHNVDFENFRLFQILEEQYHLELGWGQRTFQAQAADQHVARMLQIKPCDPVMYMEQLLYLRDGSPIEVSNLWIRGNSFRLSAFVKRGERREPAHNTLEFDAVGSNE
jgi:DNA-binding GntR family transcriptional regulator